MKIDYRNIDFMVFLPCPMKAAFGKIANQLVLEYEQETGEHIRFLPVSAMDEEMARDFLSIQRAEDYPSVMMVPGFGFPYTQSFMKRFRNRDCFESILPETHPLFREYGLYDPEHIYDIVGLSSIAFFLDRSYHPELEPPTSWHKLLFDEQYVRTVGMPGREDSGFQDFPILAAYQLYGMEGVERLARTAKTCLIPAEMVRMAGSRRDIAPAVGILNLAMAQAAGQKNTATACILPEEGLYVQPITLLTRKDASEKAKRIARLLLSSRTANAFRIGGFYSAADPEPLGNGKLFWCGWDFIKEHDLPTLSRQLSAQMYQKCDLVYAGQALKGGCTV